jgi:hypothetical protein
MKKKELRSALVCYGGVSLVLYKQGIIKEFVELVRASKYYYSIDDLDRRQTISYAELSGDNGRELDTEKAYFAWFQAIGRKIDLRVIGDSVAGASAGGVSAEEDVAQWREAAKQLMAKKTGYAYQVYYSLQDSFGAGK